jgi:hypothetical protein
MEPFITFRDTDGRGELQYYILQRAFPHYVSKIEYKPSETALYYISISGYYLYVVFDGSLQGRFLPSYKDAIDEMQVVVQNMAEWFYTKRVVVEPNKYKKWKI